MGRRKATSNRRRRTVSGAGGIISTVVNKAIDLLPFEAHLPGYNYCGPGTNLVKRLARGDKGINPLDEACKLHDIAYSKYSDSERRRQADKELAERAWRRFKASDSSLGEKAAAWAVTTGMKVKTKMGAGSKKRKTRGKGLFDMSRRKQSTSKKAKGLYLKPYKGAGKRKGRVTKKKRQSR